MKLLIKNLIRFTISRDKTSQIIKYTFLAFIFFPFLIFSNLMINRNKQINAEPSTAGDDIYPVF
jgi:hypothetical protein